MAKVSKSFLKEIVKECLVEILSEGINFKKEKVVEENYKNKSRNRNVTNMLPNREVINEKFEENSKNVIAKATNDPVMAEIFADTASTTLQEQLKADGNKQVTGHLDKASVIASENNPEDLFSESSANWAQLAFSQK